MIVSSRRFVISVCASLLSIVSIAPAAAAQCTPSTDYYLPVRTCLRSYTGDAEYPNDSTKSIPHNCRQQYRLFLPEGTAPMNGWPVVIRPKLENFATSEVDTCILKNSPDGELLERSIAVVLASLTISTTTLDCEDEPSGCSTSPDSETITGQGLFHPPGSTAYDSNSYAMPEKDVVMLVQHVRHNADVPGHILEPLDSARIAVYGGSASATSLMWTTLAADRSGELPFGPLDGQFAEKTRPDVAVLRGGTVWFPIFDEGVTPKPGEFELHFGDQDHPSVPATSLGACSNAELQAGSALFYQAAFDPADAEPELSLPLLLVYHQPSYCHDYLSNGLSGPAADPDTYAFSFTGGGVEGPPGDNACDQPAGSGHPRWNGFLWRALHPGASELVVFGEITGPCHTEALVDYETATTSGVHEMIAIWLDEKLDALPIPWTSCDLALVSSVKTMVAIPGANGVPQLVGTGDLENSPNTLSYSHGQPSTTSTLYVGRMAAPVGSHGGVFVPGSLIYQQQIQTDGTGSWSISVDEFLSLPAGTELWLQVTQSFGTSPTTYLASNALRVIMP